MYTWVKIHEPAHLRFAILLYVNDISEMFQNGSGPSVAHVFCGMYMIGIHKYPDLTLESHHSLTYMMSHANI